MNVVLSAILFIAGTVFLGSKVNLEIIYRSQFNVITINTVIIGFLFTSLSLLLGFFKEDLLEYLEDMDCMEKIYKKISHGIGLACVTIAICFFNLLYIYNKPEIASVNNYFLAIEVTLVIFVFVNFLLALINVEIVIKSIRKERKRKRDEERANKKINGKLSK
ncbi:MULTISPECIES: hypothetical protein [Clostridium]|jgi:hypothetical protein|uniref:hypothetical protein n=1 Tax=Clostridium TaxID=1485 RepID=UPI0005C20CBB|nr:MULTISPECIES: hypothetical protein [Clostridium]DAL61992.1 MAG TPA_asm: Protein of unknown function (DUF3169) [Caudoviricetes sp.]KIU07755.1 hypothetical protein SC08_Contig83orf01676 [Clostridium butyricum]MBA8967586.1 putative membrane protein [Clostridium butyricum]MBA8971347.1 putative membrane protein [Clostridium butyricum]MBC2429126.1 hypothetical protein [Clostridium butyricum]